MCYVPPAFTIIKRILNGLAAFVWLAKQSANNVQSRVGGLERHCLDVTDIRHISRPPTSTRIRAFVNRMPSSCRLVRYLLVVSGGCSSVRRLRLPRSDFHEIFIRQHSRYEDVNMGKDIKYNFIMFYSLFLEHNSSLSSFSCAIAGCSILSCRALRAQHGASCTI